MSDVSVVRRSVPFLALLGFLGCSSVTPGSGPPAPPQWTTPQAASNPVAPGGVRNLCINGTGSDDADFPVICIDDTVTPPKIITDKVLGLPVHDVVGGERNTRVYINWYTKTPNAKLGIRFRNENNACVSGKVWCTPDGGHCRVRTKRVTSKKSCEYDVLLDNVVVVDPIIIVQPCSPASVPQPYP